jgi:hypothetical protein
MAKQSSFAEIKARQARERAELERVMRDGSPQEKRALREKNHAGYQGLHWRPGIRQELDVAL